MSGCSVISGDIFLSSGPIQHDENRDRLILACSGIPETIPRYTAKMARVADLTRVHDPTYIEMIQNCSACGGHHYLDPSTCITEGTYTTTLFATGASIQAMERTLDFGEHSFAMIRPPGHHAERARGSGFCLFNNAAVAAAAALERVKRVAILDWDVHHGNGTQEIFSQRDDVLYCSIHQGNSFPGTGWVDEIGSGRGKGFTVNAPLREGSTIADYRYIFEEVFFKVIDEFVPDLLIISAGQDALWDDPKGAMKLIPHDFGILTGLVREVTSHPLTLVLEGGYGPSHGEAIAAIFSSLMGAPLPPPQGLPHRSTEEIASALKRVIL